MNNIKTKLVITKEKIEDWIDDNIEKIIIGEMIGIAVIYYVLGHRVATAKIEANMAALYKKDPTLIDHTLETVKQINVDRAKQICKIK